MDELIASLRQYLDWDVPTERALQALRLAKAELPEWAGPARIVKRAAYLIRIHEAPRERHPWMS